MTEEFFHTLYDGCSGFINIRAIPPTASEFYPLTEYSWLPRLLDKYKKSNLYFGVATRDGEGGAKENVVDIPALWLDVDFKNTPKQMFDSVLPKFPLPPTAVVMSGGGYHIYWKLKEPAKKTQQPEIEHILKSLAMNMRGDLVAAEIARILRIPGSFNMKPEYGTPIAVSVQTLDPANRYSLDDFAFLPVVKENYTPAKNNSYGWFFEPLTEGVDDGGRNFACARLVGRYIQKGLDDDEIQIIIGLWNERNKPPLSQAVIDTTIKSVRRTDNRKPKEEKEITFGEVTSSHISNVISSLKIEISSGNKGIDPGYNFLRKTIRYIQPGHLWIAGGYTSVGKSFFVSDLIMRVIESKADAGVALFSTEMSRHQYVLRLVSRKTGIATHWIRENEVTELQSYEVDQAYDYLKLHNIYLFDNLYKFNEIKAAAEKIKETSPLHVMFIDFIQNLYGQGTIYERMALLSPQIQELAKSLGVCIVALSQVSNEAAKEELDIIGYKGAGEIAAAADLGLWLERDKKDNLKLIMSVRKNRHGAVGKSILRYDQNFTRLDEIGESK